MWIKLHLFILYLKKIQILNTSHSICVQCIMRLMNLWTFPEMEREVAKIDNLSKMGSLYIHMLGGCTPLKKIPILSYVKAWSKNRYFRVFIMISISQTHVFLKDYIRMHQMEAILWVVTSSIFRRLSKKTKTPFCKLLALGDPRLLVEETKFQISTSTTKNKQAKAIFQFYFIPNYLSAHLIKKKLQNRVGEIFLVVCYLD